MGIEREATIGSADSTSLPGGGLPTAIDSLTHLENYYQSKYEHYLAMATEAKEHRDRVGLLLQDLCRDVAIDRQQNNGSLERRSPDNRKASATHSQSVFEADVFETSDSNYQKGFNSHALQDSENTSSPLLPSTESPSKLEESSAAIAKGISRATPGSEASSDRSPSQMKKFLRDLSIAMSVIESVSNSDSGKALHQNYLHHLLNRELEKELSVETIELYLEEAVRRGYLEPDEFNNNCYIAKLENDLGSKASQTDRAGEETSSVLSSSQISNIATEKATNRKQLATRESGKPYDLPESDKLKPTLFETIEEYLKQNRPKRFSIDDVINYLYPQPIQSDWNKVQRNKVRTSVSNALSRKTYLGKYWSRIKPGVYRPLT